jgi:hypothetical protein
VSIENIDTRVVLRLPIAKMKINISDQASLFALLAHAKCIVLGGQSPVLVCGIDQRDNISTSNYDIRSEQLTLRIRFKGKIELSANHEIIIWSLETCHNFIFLNLISKIFSRACDARYWCLAAIMYLFVTIVQLVMLMCVNVNRSMAGIHSLE